VANILTKSTFRASVFLGVSAAGVILLAGWLYLHTRATNEARQVADLREAVRDAYGVGRPFHRAMQELTKQHDDLQARLQSLVAAVAFVPGEGFHLDPADSQPGLAYMRKRDELQTRLLERAARAGVVVPQVLDPRGKTAAPADADAAAMMFRFAMNSRIVRAAIDARVQSVESLQYDLRPPVSELIPFIRPVQVTAKFSGSPESLMRCLHALQRTGGGLLHLRAASLTPEEERADQVRGVFKLEALQVHPDGLLPEELAAATKFPGPLGWKKPPRLPPSKIRGY